MKEAAIILAAGQGSRYDHPIPKQFSFINDYPLLWHSVKAFYAFNPSMELILVLNENDLDRWNEMLKSNGLSIKHQVVRGGKTRSESVKHALNVITECDEIYIHDAARPCITPKFLQRLKSSVELHGSAIPIVPYTEIEGTVLVDGSKLIELDQVYSVQTPQGFKCDVLKSSYQSHFNEEAKDDSEVVERAGFPLHYVIGLSENIKLTFRDQKEYVERFLQTSQS